MRNRRGTILSLHRDQLFARRNLEAADHRDCSCEVQRRLHRHDSRPIWLSFSVRKRSEFMITDTELSDIASAAMIGLRRRPKAG